MKPAPFQLLTAPDLPAALPLLSDGAAETKPVAASPEETKSAESTKPAEQPRAQAPVPAAGSP